MHATHGARRLDRERTFKLRLRKPNLEVREIMINGQAYTTSISFFNLLLLQFPTVSVTSIIQHQTSQISNVSRPQSLAIIQSPCRRLGVISQPTVLSPTPSKLITHRLPLTFGHFALLIVPTTHAFLLFSNRYRRSTLKVARQL
jgi:hypothetical protein